MSTRWPAQVKRTAVTVRRVARTAACLSRVARVTSLPPSATRVLDEVRAAGLDLARVPGSAAQIRLILDLRAELGESGTLRVLDAGCGGRSQPLNVWELLDSVCRAA